MILVSNPHLAFLQSSVKRNYYLGRDFVANKHAITLGVYSQLLKPKQKIILIATNNWDLKSILADIKNLLSLVSDGLINRDVAAPYYELGLINGSRIRGFVCSPKCYTLQGQDANSIFVNELQSIDPDMVRGGIYPVLHSFVGSQLFATMTNTETEHYTDILESIENNSNARLIDDRGYIGDDN